MFATVYHVVIADDPWVLIPAWLTLALLVVAAAVGLRQVGEAKELRKLQVRPYVTLDLTTKADSPTLLYLVVENTGRSIAQNVTFKFSPELKSTLEGRREQDSPAAFFGRSWPTVVPGKRIETLFESAIARLADDQPLPSKYDVTITYTAPALGGQQFVERCVIDIDALRGLQFTLSKGLDELAKAAEGILQVVKAWSRDNRLDVLTEDREHYDAEQKRLHDELWAEHKARVAAQQTASEDPPGEGPTRKESSTESEDAKTPTEDGL